MPENTDYSFLPSEAKELMGIAELPHEYRRQLLRKFAKEHTLMALADLFSRFIGMANSVVANNREMLEMYLISEQGMHPYTAEKINLPTIFGALQGCTLVEGIDQTKTCETCAFRLGTPPNQSPVTTTDADWVMSEKDTQFMCHHDMDEHGNPTRKCTGYTQRMAQLKKEAAQ